MDTSTGWPQNPLPIVPAARALGIAERSVIAAELFQNAGCNWRCWYCYVPFDRLGADPRTADWVSPSDLVAMYAALPQRPAVLVLSGGQPDLTPEWIPRTLEALAQQGLSDSTYLWSDDNLSNDYYWRYLTGADRLLVRRSARYGRVACFKGFDGHSFAFNTQAAPELFQRQFEIVKRLIAEGLDVYAYATFTSDSGEELEEHMSDFVDRLQSVSPNLPLRLIPLEIQWFTPLAQRTDTEHYGRYDLIQQRAITAWNAEVSRRFSALDQARPIVDVAL